MASKATLMRRKSSDEGAFRSRSADLVITKSHGMSPVVERDDFSPPVRPPCLFYGRPFFGRRLLMPDVAQLEVKLQCISHDRRAAALPAPRLFFDQRSHFTRQRH